MTDKPSPRPSVTLVCDLCGLMVVEGLILQDEIIGILRDYWTAHMISVHPEQAETVGWKE